MSSVSRSLSKESPSLMGVINLTTDSFSDGGNLLSGNLVNVSKTLRKVEKLINEGADILDFGAESTRPGFTAIPSQIQIDRLIPILEQIKDEDIIISVDSRDYKVLHEASKFGMKFVNDVSKNISLEKLKLVKEKELFICTTHQGNIKQKTSNILKDVDNFFKSKEKLYLSKGLSTEKCFFDPGFGFEKNIVDKRSKAVLEIRCHETPFILEDGQIIGKLIYETLARRPNATYGELIGSNYQGQTLKLSKHFKNWQ